MINQHFGVILNTPTKAKIEVDMGGGVSIINVVKRGSGVQVKSDAVGTEMYKSVDAFVKNLLTDLD